MTKRDEPISNLYWELEGVICELTDPVQISTLKRVQQSLSAGPELGAQEQGEAIKMSYTNYRCELSIREVLPIKLWFGATKYHTEEQWILTALDCAKNEDRDFALADCIFSKPIPAQTFDEWWTGEKIKGKYKPCTARHTAHEDMGLYSANVIDTLDTVVKAAFTAGQTQAHYDKQVRSQIEVV